MSRENPIRTRFPRRRQDGTFSVAVRLRLADATALARLDEYVMTWPRLYADAHDIQAEAELLRKPQLVVSAPKTIEIVFDGRAESLRWKDLMVHLVQHVPADVPVEFLGFHDLVSREVHPGSVP